ncbi:MAG: bifunctional phosphopantothenoylcysteine decarboxylase/phosphopantothenate--cysteine ligase CoaBC [Chloroflexota bacterium]|nr:bifunctional phosphopantothenoylcysteine decarboxylase/phosphopantothenate--cysteine ligase CoaBC [Chloroflexota bacterium]
MSLQGRNIILGVSGSIAAYKVVQVARDLTQHGARVDVLMTEGATRFVTPLTFQTLTRRSVITDLWQDWTEDAQGHISLGEEADIMLVAPASAQTLARLALGLADDMVSLTALATYAPLVLAPAMNYHMWEHPATREHVRTLQDRGATVLTPGRGRLASGAVGEGRLAAPAEIVGAVRWRLGRSGKLAGKRVVVTAGGTREALDPVRYLTNGSSGRMGYALAQAAIDAGADVTLVSANVELSPPWGATLVPVTAATEMFAATEQACKHADVLVMAAAVSDYRPENPSDSKLTKTGGAMEFRLVENPDIVASISRPGLLKVGFAAETENLIENAHAKLERKGLALIVANDAEATIGAPNAALTLLYGGDRVEELGMLPKEEAAERVISAVARLLGA